MCHPKEGQVNTTHLGRFSVFTSDMSSGAMSYSDEQGSERRYPIAGYHHKGSGSL